MKFNVLKACFYINPRDEMIKVGNRFFPQYRMKTVKIGEANSMEEAKRYHPAPILEAR